MKRFDILTTTISRQKKEINPKLNRNKQPIKIDNKALKKDVIDYPDSYSYERALRLCVSASGVKHAKNDQVLGVYFLCKADFITKSTKRKCGCCG